jgi:hypothetical protein
MPNEIQQWWSLLYRNRNLEISALSSKRKLCRSILDLLATADAASYDIGIYFPYSDASAHERLPGKSVSFAYKADQRLLETLGSPDGSTLCLEIHQSRARILPKMHTPQNGLTVRSLSHHLALCAAPDLSPKWLSAGVEANNHIFNILVVPWPSVIDPSQFQSSRKVKITDEVEGRSYGLFTYAASKGPSPAYIASLLEDATRRIGPVDAIVFPELAMSASEFERLADTVGRNRFLVAGVGTTAKAEYESGSNVAMIQAKVPIGHLEAYTQFSQQKHHRWKLTKSQILQYGIGQNLHPGVNWWEHIMLGHRSLSFVTLREWLTASVLICEDLARPDPMGEILRAVGPNLIIALLCDAPQLVGRWPARYAGAFADDPGSSVLTITSAGMANLSQPRPGSTNRCRTIALWRDAKTDAHEIELPPGADAVLLNLSVEYHEEWTADGRPDGKVSGYPILAASHPIFAVAKKQTPKLKKKKSSVKKTIGVPSKVRSNQNGVSR